MQRNAKKLYRKHRSLILYGVIGGSGALLDFLVFLFLFNVINIPAVPATMISVLFGITNNFILNTIFNFKKTDRLFLRYLSFTSVGLFGLFLSAYILAFGEVFGLDPNVVKLLSIPPVVLMQYLLNKQISFREISSTFSVCATLRTFLNANWGLLLINLVFIFVALFFIKAIPFNSEIAAPDESIHYKANVGFIIENHRLPVSGEDDIHYLSKCRDNDYGSVPCLYSYAIYPAANYIFSAATAVMMHSVTGMTLETGARFASLFFGLAFVNFLYLTAYRLSKNREFSWGVASIGLMPQILFVSSYVNQDAHSLAIGAVCAYAIVAFLQRQSTTNTILAAIAFGGLLPLAKYNYFILAIVAAFILIYVFMIKKLALRNLLQLAGFSIIAFLALSAFWYVRNFLLYADPLGQNFVLEEMSNYHALGVVLPYSYDTLQQFIGLGFFTNIFNSFFAAFGYMYIWLPDSVYTLIYALVLASLMYTIYVIYSSKPRHKIPLLTTLLALLVAIGLTVGLALYNSVKNDFQPQGRYLYPILPVLAASLSFAYHYDKRFKYIAWVFVFIIVFLLSESIPVVIQNYTP